MTRTRRNGAAHDGGFTLIELLLVIIILGVLSAVVVFSVRGIDDRGATSACEASRATIKVSVESYFALHAAYPASLSDLKPNFVEDIDQSVSAGPPPYTNTVEGGPGKWRFRYTFTSPTAFALSECAPVT